MDELFFRVVSVLIAFLALRGPVKDSASKELFQAMGFADEFFPSAYLAVAHIILTFLGNDFRYFDEVAIVSGFAMCIWLVLELYSYQTVVRLAVFTYWFSIVLAILMISAAFAYYVSSFRAHIARLVGSLLGYISGWVVSSRGFISRTVPRLFTNFMQFLRFVWGEVSAFWEKFWERIITALLVLTLLTVVAIGLIYYYI